METFYSKGKILQALGGDRDLLYKIISEMKPGQGLRVTNAGKVVVFDFAKKKRKHYKFR